MAFVSLAIIALVAFASPFIASAIPGKPVPETVFLLVLGAVLGPHMLGVIHVDAEVSLVSELGLAFLFLLAGFEIDPKSITGVEGRYGLATWVVTFGIAWLAVRFTPWFSVSHFDGIAVTLALTSTALGTLVPIMRERSLTGTRVGDSILAYGTWGELGPVLAMVGAAVCPHRHPNACDPWLVCGGLRVAGRGPEPLQARRQPLLCVCRGTCRYHVADLRAPDGAHPGHTRGVLGCL